MAEEITQQPQKENGMNMMMVGGIVAVVIVAGIAFVMTKGKETSVQPESKEIMQLKEESTPSSAETMEKGQAFTVTGANFKFEPNEMRVKKGQKVTITFTNTEGFHDFKLDEFNVKTKQLAANVSETVEFTPDQTGSFEFYCSVGNHRAQGMKGTLVVE